MKYCIAVQETLRREIVVEAGSLEDALDHVENEYDKQNIITYWANRAKVPEEKRVAEWGHEQIARDGELHIHVVEPFDQDDTEWYILTKEKFMEGLKRWLEVPGTELIPLPHGERLGVDTSQIDGAAADEIIQYALFGEVVYG